MSDYRRLISYIYAYEGGKKGKNIGFAKIDMRGPQCRIQVNVKKVYVGSSDVGVYLLHAGGELLLGRIFIRGGAGEFRTQIQSENVDGSGLRVDDCYGLTIHELENAWQSYTTIWEDAVAPVSYTHLEIRKVVCGIIYHGFKHGIHNGFRIIEIGGQIFLHILPFPAQVIHSQIQVGVNAEGGFGVGFQQLTEQRIQSVV